MKTMKFNTLAACLAAGLALSLGTGHDGSLGLFPASHAQEKVSPEVGKQLQAVQTLLKSGRAREALAKIRDVEAVGNRNGGENAIMERLRFAAAQQAGEPDTMARAFDALKGSGRLGGGENLQYIAALSGTYLRANQNGKALTWANRYFSEGGTDPAMRQVQTVAQYASGDVGPIVKSTMAEVQAAEKAGHTPSRDKLNLLLNAASKAKDTAAETYGTEKLLQYYPSKEVWASVLSTTASRKGFSPRFQLDLLRLRLATDNMRGEADYMELAQLAAQSGFPDEGKRAVEAGFKAGALGQGKDAARHERLKGFMDKKAADTKAAFAANTREAQESKDGNALILLGLYQATAGDPKRGAAMIQEGIDKGGIKREEDAKLMLGQAHLMAGDLTKAQSAWRTVTGTDGVAEVARLMTIYAKSLKK
jgi:hypothetical protein